MAWTAFAGLVGFDPGIHHDLHGVADLTVEREAKLVTEFLMAHQLSGRPSFLSLLFKLLDLLLRDRQDFLGQALEPQEGPRPSFLAAGLASLDLGV
jgi:hypothetical protein